jgi:GH25 family lysozyme M1 (1,4-beta-N-acetylmuramidase)
MTMRRFLVIVEIHGNAWEIDPLVGDNYVSVAARIIQDSRHPAELSFMNKTLFALLCLVAFRAVTAHAQFIPGIDVSRWQGDINWSAVKNAGVEFAFCKATEGVDFVDIKFLQNMNNASAAGVYIGPYHFARINSNVSNPLDAVSEAHDFVDAIEPFYQTPGKFLRPVIDVENYAEKGSLTANRTYLSQWVRDFAGVVEARLGLTPIIYTMGGYANNLIEPDLAQYPLWLASWSTAPPNLPNPVLNGVWDDWTFWQYSDSGSIPGIAGAVDLDVYRGTREQFYHNFVVGAVPEPAAAVLSVFAAAMVLGRARIRRCNR